MTIPNWLKIACICSLGALGLGFAAFLILFFVDANTPSKDAVSTSLTASTGSDKDLLIRGVLDRNNLSTGEKLRLHLAFENHSAMAMRIRVLDFETPGFRPLTPPTPFDLNARGLKAFDFDVEPSAGGRFRIGMLSQVSPAFGGTVEPVLSLGPVEVRTTLGTFLQNCLAPARQIYAVVKDFTLPFVLAALAYFFQRHQSARDQDAASKRETRESRQQKSSGSRL